MDNVKSSLLYLVFWSIEVWWK